MILSGKRQASSPAEAEKKKPDSKTTPTESAGAPWDVAEKGYQPPIQVTQDWDEGNVYDDNSWQLSSPRRRRKWSTG
jgi:hypothetical protein